MNGNRRLVVAFGGVVLLAGAVLSGLASLWQPDRLEPASWLSGVLGLFVAFVALVVAWPRGLFRTAASTPDQVDLAARTLAEVGGVRWREELDKRRVSEPHPIALNWLHASSVVTDPAVGRRMPIGEPEDVERLVILGPAGAGKTTAAMLVVARRLTTWRLGGPVPVLISLAGWNPRADDLFRWVAKRIAEDFPALRDREVFGATGTTDLVSRQQVLLVLDGLDEVAEPLRSEALTQINRRVPADRPLVLTCRLKEFRLAVADTHPIRGAEVRQIAPVSTESVIDYFRRTVQRKRQASWKPIFTELAKRESAMAAAMSTPLMMFLARAVYADGDGDPTELLDLPTRVAVEDQLLDRYVPTAYRMHGLKPRTVERWVCWTKFLAQHLHMRRTQTLRWWELTTALPGLALGTLAGIVVSAVYLIIAAFGLLALRNVDPAGQARAIGMEVLSAAFLAFLALLLVLVQRSPFLRPAKMRLSGRLRPLGRLLLQGTRVGCALMVPITMITAIVRTHAGLMEPIVDFADVGRLIYRGVFAGIIAGVLTGGLIAVVCWLVASTRQPSRKLDELSPAATLKDDLNAAVISGLVAGVVLGCLMAVFSPAPGGPILLGLGVALIVCVCFHATGWYVAARIWFSLRGQLPWRFMRFLDVAQSIGVLRRSGTAYQFRHLRLVDRLAASGARTDATAHRASSSSATARAHP